MKKLMHITQNILIAIMICIVAINLSMLYQKVVQKDNLPTFFGYSAAVVTSGSMQPTYEIGDLLIFQTQSEYQVGDAVVFHKEDNLVTHRIIGEVTEGFITQGDANNAADDMVLQKSNIGGKVVYSIKNFGTVVAFAQSSVVLATIACMLVLFLIWDNAIKKKKQTQTEINLLEKEVQTLKTQHDPQTETIVGTNVETQSEMQETKEEQEKTNMEISQTDQSESREEGVDENENKE